MAKLTKEEIQALLKVADYHWFHQEKKVTVTNNNDHNDSRGYTEYSYIKETVTHLVQLWDSRPNLHVGKAWSRDEDTAWRSAYKRLMKEVANG
jgi:hypothetical protein